MALGYWIRSFRATGARLSIAAAARSENSFGWVRVERLYNPGPVGYCHIMDGEPKDCSLTRTALRTSRREKWFFGTISISYYQYQFADGGLAGLGIFQCPLPAPKTQPQ